MNKIMKEIKLKTKDSVEICANYYCGENSFENNKSIVIVAPGWCMTKDSGAFLKISQFFAQYFDVLSLDFRGHGKSKGFFTFGAKEIFDLEACVDFLKKYENIYLAGFSLGAMTSLIYSSSDDRIKKIIAVSAPSDFDKIENKMWKKEAWGETFKKFELKRFLSIRPSLIPYKKIKPIDIIEKITQPTLFIAGKKDPTVCFWHSEKLYNCAKCKKKFELFDEGIHAEDIFLHFRDKFEKICLDWLLE